MVHSVAGHALSVLSGLHLAYQGFLMEDMYCCQSKRERHCLSPCCFGWCLSALSQHVLGDQLVIICQFVGTLGSSTNPHSPIPLGTRSRISITTSTNSDTGTSRNTSSVAPGAGSNADPASGAEGTGALGVQHLHCCQHLAPPPVAGSNKMGSGTVPNMSPMC